MSKQAVITYTSEDQDTADIEWPNGDFTEDLDIDEDTDSYTSLDSTGTGKHYIALFRDTGNLKANTIYEITLTPVPTTVEIEEDEDEDETAPPILEASEGAEEEDATE